ncbi:hypothetical protein Cal6303_5127 [Calothrix sp. PCC 6303]|nr:hypothetical protein Cal6303_5127 [Calothrix sp. PCC 6303]
MAFISDQRWDLSVVSNDGKLVLAIEVKSKTNTSPEWATKFRRNMLAHGILPNALYFLMVFPDKFYLWTPSATDISEREPDYTIDAHPILNPYFERAGIVCDRASPVGWVEALRNPTFRLSIFSKYFYNLLNVKIKPV